MTRPGLVATDLDGTLLRSDLTVSGRSRRVLAAVEAAGVPLVFVTGRPVRWLRPVTDQVGRRGIAVCANGAVIWDLRTDAQVHVDPLAADLLADLTRALRERWPEAGFAVERDDTFHHEERYDVGVHRSRDDVRPVELAELIGRPAVKLLVLHPTAEPDELLAAAGELLGDTATVTHSSRHGLLEISAAGVTKATGLARVAESYGVPAEDVLAFGDMPNDVPMLTWAGRGVAVANAHPAAVAAADERTGCNDEDGVATYLQRWFPAAATAHDDDDCDDNDGDGAIAPAPREEDRP